MNLEISVILHLLNYITTDRFIYNIHKIDETWLKLIYKNKLICHILSLN
jgi:hypothetical protein